MEQNNIENQFRKKLNEREIQPSENAWDRLDAMLTVVEKPKRNFSWMYIAASFLGFILIATVFFSQTEEMTDVERENVVLQTKKGELQNNNSKVINPIVDAAEEVVLNNDSSNHVNGMAKKKRTNGNNLIINNSENTVKDPIQKEEAIAVQEPKLELDNPKVINNQQQLPTDNRQPIAGKSKVKTSYVNVDDLLASVDSPPKKEKLFKNEQKVKVSPDDLLSQVDGELELSFREKVIKSVNKNYKEVKVAIGNRNLKD